MVADYSCLVVGGSLKSCWVSVVTQRYEVSVMEEYVLNGNAAILKCHIPSFVADFVFVSSWLQDGQSELLPENNEFGTASSKRDFVQGFA